MSLPPVSAAVEALELRAWLITLAAVEGSRLPSPSVQYLVIAVGAALGANARYVFGLYVAERLGGDFPYGTFIINVTGSIVIGFFVTLVLDRFPIDLMWRLFFVTGFLGGYTTFSSYSYEGLALLLRGEVVRALVYLLGSVAAGVIGAFIGAVAAQWVVEMWRFR